MSFAERYQELCNERGIKPCSQATADAIGTTKANISVWLTKGMLPQSRNLLSIADYFHVSIDYLLERTDLRTPIDEVDKFLLALAVKIQNGMDEDELYLLRTYNSLPEEKKERFRGYLDGLSEMISAPANPVTTE